MVTNHPSPATSNLRRFLGGKSPAYQDKWVTLGFNELMLCLANAVSGI